MTDKIIKQPHTLFSSNAYFYVLADRDDNLGPIYLKGYIRPIVFNYLVYYFQGKFNYILDDCTLSHKDVSDLLVKYYNFAIVDSSAAKSFNEIDLYDNWEAFCSVHSQIIFNTVYDAEGLDDDLYRIAKRISKESDFYVFNVYGASEELMFRTYKDCFTVFGLTKGALESLQLIFPEAHTFTVGNFHRLSFPLSVISFDKYVFSWNGKEIEIHRFEGTPVEVRIGCYLHYKDIKFPIRNLSDFHTYLQRLGINDQTCLKTFSD